MVTKETDGKIKTGPIDIKTEQLPSDVMFNILKNKLGRDPKLEDIPKILLYMQEVHEKLNQD
ncbi:hypothetical protein AB2B38_011650 [Balneola sp. MJW-20]|uniref:hypothetical protein n=1 Tax=Gracilimonas aurantiaca TaxID=3234185 RepID=UPI003908C54D